MRRLLTALLLTALLSVAPPAVAQVGKTTQALVAATDDVDTPQANSTVRVGRCTGTLIAPQIVISAGHCGFYDGRFGWEPDRWFALPGRWTVGFGPDASGFRETIPVTHVNLSGNRDLVLLALERAPRADVAVPRRPLLDPPADRLTNAFWRRQNYTAAGWGGTDPGSHAGGLPTVRQTAPASGAVLDCDVGWPGAVCVRSPLSGGAQTRGEDSGGPLYWTDRAEGRSYLVGVLQGYGDEGDRYHYSWSDHQLGWPGDQGRPPGRLIDLTQRQWIRKAVDRSLCAQLRGDAAERARLRPLSLWWNPSNGDNFSTSDPAWSGCDGDQIRGYRFAGLLGSVFSPDRPQPPGTVPLYHWYSPGRGDNFVTTDPAWAGRPGARKAPDYQFVRLDGYVHDPASRPGSATRPLWSWWSAERGDNFATTDRGWAPDSRGDHYPDYRHFRLEGYVLPWEASSAPLR